MSSEQNHGEPVEFEWTRRRHGIRQAAKRFLEGDESMNDPAGERYYVGSDTLQKLIDDCGPYILHDDADTANDLRMALLELQETQKQLSDQADEISMLNAEAEMWQQRAEIAERETVTVNERLAVAESVIKTLDCFYVGDAEFEQNFACQTWEVSNCETGDVIGQAYTDEDGESYCDDAKEFNDWFDAYLSAVAAGWLPKEAERE